MHEKRGLSLSKVSKMQKFEEYEVLSFDCYGTLIDWENGILKTLRPILLAREVSLSAEQILELYTELEKELEQGKYIKYREILKEVVRKLGKRIGFEPKTSELDCLVTSLGEWKPFPDTIKALKTLKKHFKLAIISNIDDDLLAYSARHLKTKFDWVITAEQAKAYKPSKRIFEYALRKIGISPNKILHIAQSIYHDIIPAKAIGLSTVWVNRRKGKEEFRATPPAYCKPGLEVPDLKSLVWLMRLK